MVIIGAHDRIPLSGETYRAYIERRHGELGHEKRFVFGDFSITITILAGFAYLTKSPKLTDQQHSEARFTG